MKEKKSTKRHREPLSKEEVVQLIKENKGLVFVQDLFPVLDICKTTFYRWYPVEEEAYKEISESLENNRTINKSMIRDRLLKLDKPVALIALYRLLGTPEERRALSQREDDAAPTKEVIEVELK